MVTIIKRNKWLAAGILLLLLASLLAVFVSKVNADNQSVKLIYVYSSSCGYCQKFEPTFSKVIKEFPDLKVEKINILENAENMERAKALGAMVTPTLFIEQQGKVIDKMEGNVGVEKLRSFLQKTQNSRELEK
ncbi:thioredoxin family protein [Brevibacillus sp. SYSU BS000544]|uniref:thioredoxin family protein n=1 Tax=Brevibacillus sp. SYSU BS000544 TaxID=3416443 RepID=UPI003CE5B82C